MVDSEVLSGQLRANGMEVAHEKFQETGNNIVVVNTCGFIDKAKRKESIRFSNSSHIKEEGTSINYMLPVA